MMEQWYKDAIRLVQKINDWEEEERVKNKEPYLLELKPLLAIIKEKEGKSMESFLKYLIKNHPPSEGFVYDVDEEVKKIGQRKVLLNIIIKYHPDKHSTNDMLKKVKMEEITKMLNLKYESFK